VPISNFFNQVTRKAGEIWNKADRATGGWLPGGGVASPLSTVRKRVDEVPKAAAAVGFNQLPDRVNLFGRYLTGVGNRNLQLDPSTLSDLRESTREEDVYLGSVPTQVGRGTFVQSKHGPTLPQSGPVYPYGTQPKSVTNTLGRFTASADPSKNKLTFIDTYDMVNSAEDPDLVSGKSQPVKAWNEVESIWNPAAMYRNRKSQFPPEVSFNPPNEAYTPESVKKGLQATGESTTYSPATRFARALMYLAPVRPEPYDVNITVPYTGKIK
jgi:hypothetical protein